MKALERWLLLVLCAALALQLFFVLRIALAAWWDPQSTSLQRSEMWRIWQQSGLQRTWQQQWVDYAQISPHLKRAVLTAEDDGFVEHDGVQWEAIERAWERNQKAQEKPRPTPTPSRPKFTGLHHPQLAKTCCCRVSAAFCARARAAAGTYAGSVLSKQRILEIYLNNVEWGEGIFGAQAAARTTFAKMPHSSPPPRRHAWP